MILFLDKYFLLLEKTIFTMRMLAKGGMKGRFQFNKQVLLDTSGQALKNKTEFFFQVFNQILSQSFLDPLEPSGELVELVELCI